MSFKTAIQAIMGGSKVGSTTLSIDKFTPTLSEVVKPQYDFNYYKNLFKDKLDDEFIAIFEMIEDENISKKQLDILCYMLQKLYKEKYSDVDRVFIKAQDLERLPPLEIADNNRCDLKIEEVEEVKEIKEYERKEPLADYSLFMQAVRQIEEVEFADDEEEEEEEEE